ncbi:hypothetical protein B5X24_HaOG201705 [Helicoverpa armigera]|nr:hypothetical protein B5X24_HaOG201705 [Helicoverpa armigera]
MRDRVRRGAGCSQDGLSRRLDRCLGCNFALLRYQAMLVASGMGVPQEFGRTREEARQSQGAVSSGTALPTAAVKPAERRAERLKTIGEFNDPHAHNES